MATKRNGEKYLGSELHVPLSQDGQVMAYVWPVRALNVRGSWCGGPTIGIDVGNEEIIRFDCHDKPGHWHGGGYDRAGSPGATPTVTSRKGIEAVTDQVDWSLAAGRRANRRVAGRGRPGLGRGIGGRRNAADRDRLRSAATWSSRATCAGRPSARASSRPRNQLLQAFPERVLQ